MWCYNLIYECERQDDLTVWLHFDTWIWLVLLITQASMVVFLLIRGRKEKSFRAAFYIFFIAVTVVDGILVLYRIPLIRNNLIFLVYGCTTKIGLVHSLFAFTLQALLTFQDVVRFADRFGDMTHSSSMKELKRRPLLHSTEWLAGLKPVFCPGDFASYNQGCKMRVVSYLPECVTRVPMCPWWYRFLVATQASDWIRMTEQLLFALSGSVFLLIVSKQRCVAVQKRGDERRIVHHPIFSNGYVMCGEYGCNGMDEDGDYMRFTVENAGNGKVALKSCGNYLSILKDGSAVTFFLPRSKWSHFDWIEHRSGKVSLRGANGKYVSSEYKCTFMTCNRDEVGPEERFTVM